MDAHKRVCLREPTRAGPRPSDDTPRDRPFNAWRVPATVKARELVTEAVRRVEGYEHHFNLRKLKRSARHQATFEATITAIVCDLAVHTLSGDAGRVAITRSHKKLARRSRYRSPVENDRLPHVLDALASPELGIVDMAIGWHDLAPRPDRERFRQTTIAAGPVLRSWIERDGLEFADFARDDAEELIILRGTKKPRRGGTLRADPIEYTDSDLTRRLREEMRTVNAWLARVDLALPDFPHIDTTDRRLRRCFNNGRFDCGGRFSGGWWTNLSKAIKREHLLIDREGVALLDYSSFYARLAYAKVGVSPPAGDLYEAIPGLAGYRKGAKILLNSLLFDGKPRARKPKGTAELLPSGVPLGELVAAIEQAHAPIAGLFGQGIGYELMNLESTIMVRVLLRMRECGIVGLPVYDALIVARSAAESAAGIMQDVGEEIAGCPPPVTIDGDGGG